jgi:hypothetical protein
MNRIRAVSKLISGRLGLGDLDGFVQEDKAYERAKSIVPFFYYFLLFIALLQLLQLRHLAESLILAPRWPIFWADYMSFHAATTVILVFFAFSALTGAYFCRNRFGRIIAFLGILQFHALQASFGGPNHQWDLWLWVALILIFLPDIWEKTKQSSREGKKFLIVFWGAQAFLLLTYSMSGIGKLLHAALQYFQGEAHLFMFNSAAFHVYSWLNAMQATSLLGQLIIEHPLLGWFPFMFILYVQVFAFLVAFRPSLHRVWALALVLFHMGTYFGMNAEFFYQVPLLFIFLFASPFHEPGTSWRKMISDLPLVSCLLRRLHSKHVTVT